MAYYRRMVSMEEHLGGNAMSIASLRYQLRDLWGSPRGTVLRIEALALVAITLSFFLAFFGSCRRWSNDWIVQKGFLAAQVLSLSLGTYSIGLMQSSPVKSEMYPIWAVSLLTLFGCVDPVTTYIGLDYSGPLSKMIFQLCLYFGYVMLMSVSTISTDIGKLAIGVLSSITFIKGFHRALAFVLPRQIREIMETMLWTRGTEPAALAGDGEGLSVHLPKNNIFGGDIVTIEDIQKLSLPKGTPANGIMMKDVCLSYSFSLLLRQRFFGMYTAWKMDKKLKAFEGLGREGRLRVDYMRALKVAEVELAFLFDAFFTSNEFLQFYQAKTGTFWALASFIGICFVGVVTAIIPGAMASHQRSSSPGAGTSVAINNIVGTTTADLVVTLVILVSLALLQLVQLLRCWTSNWARIDIACEYAMKAKKQMEPRRRHSNTRRSGNNNQIISRWVMGLRLFLVARVNWFDKYLWQARLGQDSLAALLQRSRARHGWESVLFKAFCCCGHCPSLCFNFFFGIGVHYLCEVVGALLLSDTTNPGGVVKLHKDLKASIAEFLGTIKSRKIGVEWSALFLENGLQDWLEYLPYTNTGAAYEFAQRVMIWHIATWYCEEADKERGGNGGGGDSSSNSSREKHRRVAMDLSKYCVYLVVSAPELLPGPAAETKEALEKAQWATRFGLVDYTLEAMQRVSLSYCDDAFEFVTGVYLGKRLRNDEMKTPPILVRETEEGRRKWKEGEQSTRRPCSSDHWELLALLWVQTLLYAAPYGDAQAHLQRLAQGGEFITHLWALLYHLGIDKWEVAGIDELKGAAAAAAAPETTTREAQAPVQEDAVSGPEIQEITT